MPLPIPFRLEALEEAMRQACITPLQMLAEIVRQYGPIPTVRVSSAQAMGAAKHYAYWGAVRYEIRLDSRLGQPTNCPLGRASSDRRSVALARLDAQVLARREGRILWQGIGRIRTQGAALRVLAAVANPAGTESAADIARAAALRLTPLELLRAKERERLRAIPRWIDRIAAGVLKVPAWFAEEHAEAIDRRRREIAELRSQRRQRRLIPAPRNPRVTFRYRGIPVVGYAIRDAPKGHRVMYVAGGGHARGRSPRDAVRRMLQARVRRLAGGFLLQRHHHGYWFLLCTRELSGRRNIAVWQSRPTRKQIADAIRAYRATLPSRTMPDTLGWRVWQWNGRTLVSPHQHTCWDTPELRAEHWSDESAVRGECGIHARRMPHNWRLAGWPYRGPQEGCVDAGVIVTGVVERFGRYVLGAEGWRAEIAIIRELMAPDVPTMLALMRTYPDVKVQLAPAAAGDHQPLEEKAHGHRHD
jgi:hypothetical protein